MSSPILWYWLLWFPTDCKQRRSYSDLQRVCWVSNRGPVDLQEDRQHNCVLVGIGHRRSLQKSGTRLPFQQKTSQVAGCSEMFLTLALCNDWDHKQWCLAWIFWSFDDPQYNLQNRSRNKSLKWEWEIVHFVQGYALCDGIFWARVLARLRNSVMERRSRGLFFFFLEFFTFRGISCKPINR